MMVDLRIFLKASIKANIKNNSKPENSGMSTDSLTIWSLKLLKEKEDTSGLARTTTVMSKVIW